VILGMLVERVTGRALGDEMHARIFEPLGLADTYFAPQDDVPDGIAQGYIGASDRADVSMTFVFGTGNLVSTAADMRRFAEGLFGGRLLSPAALAEMERFSFTGGAYDMPELEYGLGLMRARLDVGPRADGVERSDELNVVEGHIGGIAGFRTALWRVSGTGVTIALGLNQADIDPNILARDTLAAILEWQGQ
jgi:CubicO group peptidase (beta-lactamase class C family)